MGGCLKTKLTPDLAFPARVFGDLPSEVLARSKRLGSTAPLLDDPCGPQRTCGFARLQDLLKECLPRPLVLRLFHPGRDFRNVEVAGEHFQREGRLGVLEAVVVLMKQSEKRLRAPQKVVQEALLVAAYSVSLDGHHGIVLCADLVEKIFRCRPP